MNPSSIEELREFAKLNMEEKCFQKYLHLIEPNIKQIIRNYFGGWNSIEFEIIQILMRVNGVYLTSTSVIFDDGDDRNKFKDLVNLEKYKKYEKLSFKRKIDLLLKKKIIGKNTYKLLDFLRKKRNKIHKFDGYLSDEDRRWFAVGFSVIADIYYGIANSNRKFNQQKGLSGNAEKIATQIMKELGNEVSS